MQQRLKRVKDPRHQSYTTYDCDLLLMMVILKNCCDLQSMRSMTNQMNKEECIDNVKRMLDLETLEELPHYDTINDFLSRLDPTEIECIRAYMIKALLQKRCLEQYRVNGKYWGVIVDGTGLFCFDEKHCDHCLRREHTDPETGEKKTIYMHHVLEAKLVVGDIVLSIGSEFIENESEDVSKQDCELKAFYRLAEKLKNTYRRLPICILGDSLYACEGVFRCCDQYRWKYMLRFKEGRIKSIATEFQTLKELEQSDPSTNLFWVNDIAYQQRTVNMLEYAEGTEGSGKRYTFLTNIRITERNAKRLLGVGRSRWKIENEGFNHQKNIRYHIEHANSHHYTAMKNHYLLTQIADILMQLYENGTMLLKEIRKTAKEISSNLLEAIRTRRVTVEDMTEMSKPKQVRFT